MTLRLSGDIRVGVVGCGYWGSKHARVLNGLSEFAEVVLVDSRQERIEALRPTFPGIRSFPSLEEALPHLDAVVIATPPSSHVALALTAIEAGKHVLVEKPLATSTFGARRLVEAADQADVTLMTGHTFEFNAGVWKMRELIDSGELGDLYYLDSARLNLGLYQNDVNVIFDLAPHDVSIINYLLGRAPTAVQAWGSRHARSRFEDVAYLRLYYEGGLAANIHVSWLDPCKVRRLTAVGSRKMAVYNDLSTDERIRVHDKGVDLSAAVDDMSAAPTSYRYGDIVAPFVAFDEPLSVQDRHFGNCILTGRTPQTDGRSGVAVVQVLECAQLSLEQGRVVSLDEAGTEQTLGAGAAGGADAKTPVPRQRGTESWRSLLATQEQFLSQSGATS